MTIEYKQSTSHWSHYAICFITLLAWFFVFIAGCTIESQPPRCELIAIQKYTKAEISEIVSFVDSKESESQTLISSENDGSQTKPKKYMNFSKYCSDTIHVLEEYSNKKSTLKYIVNIFEIIFGWGITSVGILAFISAALGASISYLLFSNQDGYEEWEKNYLWGIIRGFIVYCLYLSGLLIFSEKAFKFLENFSVLEYVKLSASISLIGFFVGFNPNALNFFLPDYIRTNLSKNKPQEPNQNL